VRGLDTLIAAPTGSGKTLAGFLVAINSLYRAHAAGEDVSGATRVVYVSPLKALAVDIAQNLERPLLEIGSVAAELGLSPAPISVAVRTGDTSASERARMLRRCPSLIVTTPESLYLLLTSVRGRDALCSVADPDRRRDSRRSARQEGLSPTDMLAVIEAATCECDRLLLRVLWATGARISEALALWPMDVQRDHLVLPNRKNPNLTVKRVYLPAGQADLPGALLVWPTSTGSALRDRCSSLASAASTAA
jgi:DEAD/DEAH box helicase